eukprot:TRINITY_DN6647_c0_g1_i1.p1 TRINITY_DN6647_c0_g1~~TRINITY_DN6647_c0_g1_i1.p1  ORF type:complete len:103 (+),score=45.51 TRINITY_DN6647_c0_g1_i1:64-372(+)
MSALNVVAALFVAMGGIMGYAKKKSVPSLVAGLTFASAFAYAAHLQSQGEQLGCKVGTAASVLLLGAMFPKYLKTKAIMPAGMCSLIGFGTAAVNGYEWSQA